MANNTKPNLPPETLRIPPVRITLFRSLVTPPLVISDRFLWACELLALIALAVLLIVGLVSVLPDLSNPSSWAGLSLFGLAGVFGCTLIQASMVRSIREGSPKLSYMLGLRALFLTVVAFIVFFSITTDPSRSPSSLNLFADPGPYGVAVLAIFWIVEWVFYRRFHPSEKMLSE